MTLQRLTLSWRSNLPLLASMWVSVPPRQCPTVPAVFSDPGRERRATWQQPLELVSIRAMYSAPSSPLPLRAANFLLLGYTNCRISILYWAATGSWGFSRHWWPVQAAVITTPQRAPAAFVWISQTNAAVTVQLLYVSYSDIQVEPVRGSYFLLPSCCSFETTF